MLLEAVHVCTYTVVLVQDFSLVCRGPNKQSKNGNTAKHTHLPLLPAGPAAAAAAAQKQSGGS